MLNLVNDRWIPVRRSSGLDLIRPHQIAEPDVLFPAWDRPDLNLACLELLVGMVYLAAPPRDEEDWLERKPEVDQLKAGLESLSSAFDLLGDGPRFMQDLEQLDTDANRPDMLFIDSAGGQASKLNKDLMVKRNRYDTLPLNIAAMALYTLQNFAPAGGAGNRTSMRGGGPMVTLVRPARSNLWPLIWANVPQGAPLTKEELTELPWMRPTKTSKNHEETAPPDSSVLAPETFFGQPRRLRLVASGGRITGVQQVPHGTNYSSWVHPLSPYYYSKTEKLPKHPKPGPFGYRSWRGVLLSAEGADRPQCLVRFLHQRTGERASLLVGGWAMSNMNPLDFVWSEPPVFSFHEDSEAWACRLVEASECAANSLASSVRIGKGEDNNQSGAAYRARESLFQQTQGSFENQVLRLASVIELEEAMRLTISKDWLAVLRTTALAIFDSEILPGLADLQEKRRKAAVSARRDLINCFAGFGKSAKDIYKALDLPLPKKEAGKKSQQPPNRAKVA